MTEYTDRNPSTGEKVLIVFGGYVVVAIIEVLTHWVLTWPAFKIALSVYLLHTASGGLSVFPDFIVPAIVLGWWNGWVSRSSSTFRTATCLVLPLALGVVVLLPLYVLILRSAVSVWWWPKTIAGAAIFLIAAMFFASIAVLLPLKAYHKQLPI